MSNANANLILPRLWLGNKKAALDDTFLLSNNISVVFNCTKDFPFSDKVQRKYRIPVDDNLAPNEIQNMETWAPEIVYKVVSEYKRGANILIHCHAGMQRSAAVMAMSLIALTNKPAAYIKKYIQSHRPVAFYPKANFEKAITGFEKSFQSSRPY